MPENNEILFRDTKQIEGTKNNKIHKIIERCYQLLDALI
jgi:hypothetical protein